MLAPAIHQKKSWLVFLLFLAIGLNLYFNFSMKEAPEVRSQWIDQFFARVAAPFQWVSYLARTGVVGSVQSVGELIAARKENVLLRDRVSRAELELQKAQEVRLENQRLRALLEFEVPEGPDYLAAKVMASDPSAYFQTLVLNRGSRQGVEVGMAVVSTEGVVGRIYETSYLTSKVLLISDVNSRVDAVVQRSRTRAIVAGGLGGGLRLRFLPRRQDLEVGDVLVTSGFGGEFPPGFRIGTIRGIKRDPNLVLEDAELEAAVDFGSIEELFIVRSPPEQKG